MCRLPRLMLFAFMLCCIHKQVRAQEATDSLKAAALRYVDHQVDRVEKIDRKMARSSGKALKKWERQQRRLLRKISRKDSAIAGELTAVLARQQAQLHETLANPSSALKQYIPSLDTLTGSVKFLKQVAQDSRLNTGALRNATGRVESLATNFTRSEKISELMKQQQQLLRDKLGSLGLLKELKSLNKTAYYYQAQVQEYKALLKDPKKAARRAMAFLKESKPFQDFMRRHSQLASLFRLPGDPNDPSQAASLAGLQTRAQVNSLIQQQIGAAGPGGAAQLRSNISQAQSELNALKDKVLKLGGGGSDIAMPDGFKPNPYKTKSFLKRIELGANIQSQRARGWLPTRSDIGLSVGYKFNENIVAGIGGSYRVGWGENIRHMKITHQGISLRSFVDVKLKGSFWLTGGYEQNQVQEVEPGNNDSDVWRWQPAGLLGVSKVVKLGQKRIKGMKLSLLYDFLKRDQKVTNNSILFRITYLFK